jgi:hypothetical protein
VPLASQNGILIPSPPALTSLSSVNASSIPSPSRSTAATLTPLRSTPLRRESALQQSGSPRLAATSTGAGRTAAAPRGSNGNGVTGAGLPIGDGKGARISCDKDSGCPTNDKFCGKGDCQQWTPLSRGIMRRKHDSWLVLYFLRDFLWLAMWRLNLKYI